MIGRIRLESLEVWRYQVLRHVRLNGLTPLTALLGHTGSGKSTVLDVLTFLSECFSDLSRAWEKRGGFKHLRTRDAQGPIEILLSYRDDSEFPLKQYHLSIGETSVGAPIVLKEKLTE